MIAGETETIPFSLPFDDRDLLKQCTVSTFRSSGKGGQYVNKTDSAVRLRHALTGITVTCRRERSQHLNKRIAVQRLRKKIEHLLEQPAERKPTSVPVAQKMRRRLEKKFISAKKRSRRQPAADE